METDLAGTAAFHNATDRVSHFSTVEPGDGNDKWTGATGDRVDGACALGGAGDGGSTRFPGRPTDEFPPPPASERPVTTNEK